MSISTDLVNLFGLACNQRPEDVKWAEEKLTECVSQPGFWVAVVNLATTPEVDATIRWQAMLYFKNALDVYWRKGSGGQHVLDQDVKEEIRNRLLNSTTEPVDQISKQMAVIISRIARIDFPLSWPDLVPRLMVAILNSSHCDLVHVRSLTILYHVIKQLSSKRLAPDRRCFKEVSNQLLVPLYSLWQMHMGNIGSENTAAYCCLISLRSLRYIIYFGFSEPHAHPIVSECVQNIITNVSNLLAARSLFSEADSNRTYLEKSVNAVLKLILDIQEIDAVGFIIWLRDALDMAIGIGFTETFKDIPDFIRLKLMNVIKWPLVCEEYRKASVLTNDDDFNATLDKLSVDDEAPCSPSPSDKAISVKQEVLTDTQLSNMIGLLITHNLGLTEDDLHRWENEPEMFACAEDDEAWRFSLRPAAESLYISLLHEYRDILAPILCRWFDEIRVPVPTADLKAVLRRDSLYASLGLGAYDLHDIIDFSNLFMTILIPQLSVSTSDVGSRILERRILWLCGKWCGLQFSADCLPTLYNHLCLIASGSERDIVVRLTAMRTVKIAADDFEFSLEAFEPYLERVVNASIGLLQECSEVESHLLLINCLTLVADRTGMKFHRHLDPLITCLPSLWTSSHNALQASILALFVPIVKAANGRVPIDLCRGLCEMLTVAVDVSQPSHVYLIEDGLDLWLALLQASQEPLNDYLLKLFRFLPAILGAQTEHMKMCLEITKSYLIFCCPQFDHMFIDEIMASMVSAFPNIRSEGIVSALKVVYLAMQCHPTVAPTALSPFVSALLWCMKTVLESEETSGVICSCASVVALGFLKDFNYTMILLNGVVNDTGISATTSYLEKWLSNAPLLSCDLEKRKLTGLALCEWISHHPFDRSYETYFEKIVNTLNETLMDVVYLENSEYRDSLVSECLHAPQAIANQDDAEFPLSEHDKRLIKLRKLDPVFTVPLHHRVRDSLARAEELVGQERFAQLLWSTVDEEVKLQLSRRLSTIPVTFG